MAKEGKLPRPQDKHLIPLPQRDPEERHAICSMGGKARAKQLRERMQLHEVARVFMTLGIRDGAAVDPEKLKNVDEAREKNIPVLMDILMTEYRRYKETGDKESRDFLLNAFEQKTGLAGIHDHEWPDDPDHAPGDPGTDVGGGARIHLIRGERPAPAGQAEEKTATRAEGAAPEAMPEGGDPNG